MNSNDKVAVSVIIPVYNGAKRIVNCLGALCNQDFPELFEVIVVDDGSTDNVAEVVSRYPAARFVRQANAGPGVARNHGARIALGEVILFTDDDCVPLPDWMSRLVASLRSGERIAGVKGVYRSKQKELTARFVQLEYEDKYDVMKRHQYIDFIDTYSAGFKRSIFMDFGGYDASFTTACAEDVDLSFRLSRAGHLMLFVPNAIVFHTHPNGVWIYLKKKYKFAYWRMLAVRKTPEKALKDSHTPQLMKLQLLFPPAIVFLLVLLPFNLHLWPLPVSAFGVFLLTCLPFLAKATAKDFPVAAVSPFLLLLRSFSQFCGVTNALAAFAFLPKRHATGSQV